MIKNFLKELADRFYKIMDEETKEHEEELIDAIEASDQCIYIEQYHGKYPVGKWKGDDINELLLSFQYTAFPWLVDFCEYNI